MKSAFVLSATLLAAVSVYAADRTLALAAPASFFSAACASQASSRSAKPTLKRMPPLHAIRRRRIKSSRARPRRVSWRSAWPTRAPS